MCFLGFLEWLKDIAHTDECIDLIPKRKSSILFIGLVSMVPCNNYKRSGGRRTPYL